VTLKPALAALLTVGSIGMATPAGAQTVYYPDPPPAARPDSIRPGPGTAPRDTTRPDTARGTLPAALAPPPPPPPPAPPPIDPVVGRACRDAAPGESAPDVLGIVFGRSSSVEARDAAIASAGGKRLAGSAEDEFQYVQVPAGGSEFRLRTIADKLIRLAGVNEVGPVLCPALPAQPAAPARDSTAAPR
jgi:hypothetical protein